MTQDTRTVRAWLDSVSDGVAKLYPSEPLDPAVVFYCPTSMLDHCVEDGEYEVTVAEDALDVDVDGAPVEPHNVRFLPDETPEPVDGEEEPLELGIEDDALEKIETGDTPDSGSLSESAADFSPDDS